MESGGSWVSTQFGASKHSRFTVWSETYFCFIGVATGAQLGAIISLPLSAVLCHFVGWQVVFYAVGNY